MDAACVAQDALRDGFLSGGGRSVREWAVVGG